MKLYLIRHGHQKDHQESNYRKGILDPELSDLGRRQAELLGKRLANHHLGAIVTSDLMRAVQTAEIVNRHLGVTLNQEPNLREIDMGEVSIKGWERIAVDRPTFFREFNQHQMDIAYPGGESGFDVLRRAMPVFERIVQSWPQESNCAIICHGGVIMVLLTAILGVPQEKRFRFRIDHCSISIIEYDSEQSFRILSVNDSAHLEEKL
jgi:broad specificity phosphatase PhoE